MIRFSYENETKVWRMLDKRFVDDNDFIFSQFRIDLFSRIISLDNPGEAINYLYIYLLNDEMSTKTDILDFLEKLGFWRIKVRYTGYKYNDLKTDAMYEVICIINSNDTIKETDNFLTSPDTIFGILDLSNEKYLRDKIYCADQFTVQYKSKGLNNRIFKRYIKNVLVK